MGFCWSLQDATVGDGFARILAAQLRRSLAVIEDRDETPARRIHAVRRRAKRMRGLCRIVRPDFPHYHHVNSRLRDAAKELSGTRDAAVLRETLVDLCHWTGHPVPEAAAPPETGNEEEKALNHYAKALEKLQDQLPEWKTDKFGAETIARGMAEEYRAGRRAMRACHKDPDDDAALHEWRKHVKYLSFHLLLLRHVLPDVEDRVGGAESLASLLGRHHDLSVLRAALAEGRFSAEAEPLDIEFLRHHARQRQIRLAAHAIRIGASLFAQRPRDLRHGILTRWHDWQASQQELV